MLYPGVAGHSNLNVLICEGEGLGDGGNKTITITINGLHGPHSSWGGRRSVLIWYRLTTSCAATALRALFLAFVTEAAVLQTLKLVSGLSKHD